MRYFTSTLHQNWQCRFP